MGVIYYLNEDWGVKGVIGGEGNRGGGGVPHLKHIKKNLIFVPITLEYAYVLYMFGEGEGGVISPFFHPKAYLKVPLEWFKLINQAVGWSDKKANGS